MKESGDHVPGTTCNLLSRFRFRHWTPQQSWRVPKSKYLPLPNRTIHRWVVHGRFRKNKGPPNSQNGMCDLCQPTPKVVEEVRALKKPRFRRSCPEKSTSHPTQRSSEEIPTIDQDTELHITLHPSKQRRKASMCPAPEPDIMTEMEAEELDLEISEEHKESNLQCDPCPKTHPDIQTRQVVQIQELELNLQTAENRYEELFIIHQDHVFKSLEPGLWKPRDDESVKADFNKLARKMKWWSKTFVVKIGPLEDTLTSEDYRTLLKALENVVDLMAGKTPGALPAPLGYGKGPAVLLNALLADMIYTDVFHNPFFCMGSKGDVLNEMYDRFLDYGTKDACVWRSDTLRRLRPRYQTAYTAAAVAAANNHFAAGIADLSTKYALQFLRGPAKFLIDQIDTEKAVSKVADMYTEAAKLSFDVWTQRTDMDFIDLHELDPRNRVFDLENPRLKPHSLVRADRHEGGLKGRPIEVVVHPQVDVCGDIGGGNYERRITWMPAEVWVDSAFNL